MTSRKSTSLFALAVLALCAANSGFAADLTGEAYGSTSDDAQRKAMAALSESLVVEVRSEFTSSADSAGAQHAQQDIKTISNLPLLGVDTAVEPRGGQYYARAILTRAKALPLYSTQLQTSVDRLDTVQKSLANAAAADARYSLLTQALTELEQHNRHYTVARLLGGATLPTPALSAAEVRQQLQQIESVAPSIELAAAVLARDVPAQPTYVYPPTPRYSHEVTAFSRAVRDQLNAAIRGTETPDKARQILRGEYEVLGDRMQIIYRATDTAGNTVAVRTAALAPAAYAQIPHQPVAAGFDKLLHEGVVVSNDFRISLNTNRGSEDLMFTDGEDLELLVKLNRSGYFYAVSHIANNGGGESYLLELNDEAGGRRFVRYIGPDDANRWVSLGSFTAGAPFGVESIQVIASSEDLLQKLPPHAYDKDAQLFRLVAANASDGVLRTRGLRPKADRKNKIESAETVLMMTIMPKSDDAPPIPAQASN
jgi:hypothetical protein